MRVRLLLLLLLLAAESSLPKSAATAADIHSSHCIRLNELLVRLSDLVDFYASDPDRVNADGYFGMRLSRDLLSPEPVSTAAAAQCGRSAGHRLESVLVRQDLLVSRFARNLAGRPGYDGLTFSSICQPLARAFQGLTESPRFQIFVALETAGSGKRWPADEAAVEQIAQRLVEYDEPQGDACLAEALANHGRCSSGTECQYFNRALSDASGYYLTHQLLYKMILEQSACGPRRKKPTAEKKWSTAISTELKLICRKAFNEFKLIEAFNWTKNVAKSADSPLAGLRDLYMEQGLLCGLLGAKDFYRIESVNNVTSWQDPLLGCFKIFHNGEAMTSGRKILRDADMLGGCSAHATGVAMGFYSNAIRFLLGV